MLDPAQVIIPSPEIVRTYNTRRYAVTRPLPDYPITFRWEIVEVFPNTPEGEQDAKALLAKLLEEDADG